MRLYNLDFPPCMSVDYILTAFTSLMIIITLIALLILVERKFLALSQRRIGPTILGRRGFMQIFADVVKPLFKEIFEQKFQTVTLIAFAIFLLLFSQLVYLTFFSYGINGTLYDNTDMVVFLQLFLGGLSCLAVVLIGYLSGTKYGVIGSVRLVVIELSVESTVGLLNSLLIANTSGMDYLSLGANQGFSPNIAILGIVYSVIYIINMFVSAQRAPLDLIENEGELVAGYNTEFSGPDVLVIYFAEYLHIFNAVIQFIHLMFGCSIFMLPSYICYDVALSVIDIDAVGTLFEYLWDFENDPFRHFVKAL